MNTVFCLVPVLLILTLAIITKRTLFAMFSGLVMASVIVCVSGESGIAGLKGIVSKVFEYIYTSITNETLQWLVLVIALFGVLITYFEKSGAITAFGQWTSKIIKTKRQTMFGTFILGIVVFVDDYLNNLTVSTAMKSITDHHKIPRTQLGYIVNSTAAPVCILLPLSTWAIYFSSLYKENNVGTGNGMDAYLQSIPFMFYGWFAILVVLLQIIGVIPKLGQIKRDYIRAEKTGDVFPEGEDESGTDALEDVAGGADSVATAGKGKANPIFFLIPLLVMVGVSVFTEIVGDIDVLIGVSLGVLTGFFLYLFSGKIKFKKLLDATYEGILSMGFVIILSVLAFAVQAANTELGLAEWVIDAVKPIMDGAFLPIIVFIVCGLYAYVTGSFWDMAVIVAPIVLPLALAIDVNPILAGSAIFSGAALGSNTCLYGDGIILAAQGCNLKPLRLMFACLPYAAIAGGASAILYLIFGFIM